MVLDHIAELPDLIVVGPTTLDPYHLADGDLDVVNAGVIPLTVDKAVGKAQNKKVLDGLFTDSDRCGRSPFHRSTSRRLIHFDR